MIGILSKVAANDCKAGFVGIGQYFNFQTLHMRYFRTFQVVFLTNIIFPFFFLFEGLILFLFWLVVLVFGFFSLVLRVCTFSLFLLGFFKGLTTEELSWLSFFFFFFFLYVSSLGFFLGFNYRRITLMCHTIKLSED